MADRLGAIGFTAVLCKPGSGSIITKSSAPLPAENLNLHSPFYLERARNLTKCARALGARLYLCVSAPLAHSYLVIFWASIFSSSPNGRRPNGFTAWQALYHDAITKNFILWCKANKRSICLSVYLSQLTHMKCHSLNVDKYFTFSFFDIRFKHFIDDKMLCIVTGPPPTPFWLIIVNLTLIGMAILSTVREGKGRRGELILLNRIWQALTFSSHLLL